MTTPPPRPALRRAADADVSPAAPRQVQQTAEPEGTGSKDRKGSKASKGSKKHKKAKKRSHGTSESDSIAVSFTLSQRDLTRLDDRADELGHSRERTLTLLVQAWLDS